MVVTGDRDAYQLVAEPENGRGGVRIMTTSRGITDTRVYDRQGVVERYGIPPELIPDFIGLKGDTSDNIPGVPGIGDKTAADLLQRFGDLEGVLSHVEDISGAKRKQNLIEHADDARLSKQLATIVPRRAVELDLPAEMGREPDRSRLREVFREFELRDPLRRLEEALELADVAEIPRPETAEARTVPVRRGAARRPRAPRRASRSRCYALAPVIAEGELIAVRAALGLRRLRRRRARRSRASATTRPSSSPPPVTAPVVAHDAKALGDVPPRPRLRHRGRRLPARPARRAYPLDELCEERGMAVDAEDPRRRAPC